LAPPARPQPASACARRTPSCHPCGPPSLSGPRPLSVGLPCDTARSFRSSG
jgi:hypothetical protein